MLPRLLLLLTLTHVLYLLNPSFSLAVTESATNSAAITATVPVFFKPNPDPPVLISPSNNSHLATTAPNFIFRPSTNDAGTVSHFQLWIDGNKNTDHIPQSSAATVTTIALTALTEGQHTWKIKAIGTNGETTDSATWTFTIDITAPLILVNQVAQHQTILSSLDLSTIPFGLTFITTDRQPVFAGQGEALASLTITLTSLDHQYNFNTTVPADTDFNFIPTSLLAEDNYTVSISSTDSVGNSTTLPSFFLNITAPKAIVITIPLPSPLPPITITIPSLPQLAIPQLPQTLKAFPLAPTALEAIFWLPWLIILLLIIHIYLLRKHPHLPFKVLLPLIIAWLILIFLAITNPHWVTIGLSLIIAWLFLWELKKQ